MPYQIKDKRTGEVKASGVIGRTLRCGHCDHPVLDDTTWIALDDPYYCLVHETCMYMFNYNNLSRLPTGQGKRQANQDLDTMQRELHQMASRPWWQNNKTTKRYHKALQDMLLLHQSLRTSGVITDKSNSGIPQPSANAKPAPFVISREQLQASTTATSTTENKELPTSENKE